MRASEVIDHLSKLVSEGYDPEVWLHAEPPQQVITHVTLDQPVARVKLLPVPMLGGQPDTQRVVLS